MPMGAARLTRDERREQLLNVALEIIRSEGTNALTLVRLAERAGVSRPVAYDHFATRDGLLVALYEEYDARLGTEIRRALGERSQTLEQVVTEFFAAYIDGVRAAGSECEEVYAALDGSPETREVLRRSREFYLNEFRTAVAPYVRLAGDGRDLALLIGVFGTVDSLAKAAAKEQITRSTAVTASNHIGLSALRTYAEG